MSTGTVIVNDALRYLNLNNGILPVDPRNQATAFAVLVDLLKLLRGDGLYVVRQFPAAINAELREPSWSTPGLKEMLAKMAAPYLRTAVPDSLGSEGERVLRTRARPPISCSMPDTLPMGSGNYDTWWPEWFLGPDELTYEYYAAANRGESATFYADFDFDAVNKGTTVSSVVWSVISGSIVGISNQSLSDNIASAQLSFTEAGNTTVRARATYANGQTHDFLIKVSVSDA